VYTDAGCIEMLLPASLCKRLLTPVRLPVTPVLVAVTPVLVAVSALLLAASTALHSSCLYSSTHLLPLNTTCLYCRLAYTYLTTLLLGTHIDLD
jgi:hypothetical protein